MTSAEDVYTTDIQSSDRETLGSREQDIHEITKTKRIVDQDNFQTKSVVFN